MALNTTGPYRQHTYIGAYVDDTAANLALLSVSWSASAGLLYWNTTNSELRVFDGAAWQPIVTGAGSSPWTSTGTVVHLVTGTNTVAVGATTMSGTEKFRVLGNVRIDADGSSLGNLILPAPNQPATQGALIGGTTRLLQRYGTTVWVGNSGVLGSAGFYQEESAIVGEDAMIAANAYASGMVAIGYNVAREIDTNGDAVVIGRRALIKSGGGTTGARYSTIIGNYAAGNLGSGASIGQSVIVGRSAAYSSSSITTSQIIGYQAAGGSASTISNSTFIGYQAGYNAGVINYVVAIGSYAGYNLWFDDYAVCIGYAAGRSVSGGRTGFVAIGTEAMGGSATAYNGGTESVAVGAYALRYWYAGTNYNTAVGAYALLNLLTSATSGVIETTAVGYGAGGYAYNASYCVYLGSYAGYTNNASNRLYIGTGVARAANPLIYGEFDNYLVRINGKLALAPLTPITKAPFNLAMRSAAPTAPVADDIYLDDGTNTSSGNPGWRRWTGVGAVWEDISAGGGGTPSPWTSAAGVIYPVTLTDTVAINSTTMSAASDEVLFVKDTDETASTRGIAVELEKNSGTAAKTGWKGVEANIIHTGTNHGGIYTGFVANLDFASAYTLTRWTGLKVETDTGAGSMLTTMYGVYIDEPTGTGGFGTTYGLYIAPLEAGTAEYGIFQESTKAVNYFAGKVGINQSLIGSAMLDVRDDEEDAATWGGRFLLEKDGAGTKAGWVGVEVQADHSAEETGSLYVGFMADINFTPENSTLTTAYGFRTQLEIQESTSVCGTWYGVMVESNPGSGDIDNAYGVYIDSQIGSTLSYGVYQASFADRNYFAGVTGIISTPSGFAYLDVDPHRDVSTVGAFSGVTSDLTKTGFSASNEYRAYNTELTHNTGNGTLGGYKGLNVSTPAGTSAGTTIANIWGVYIEELKSGPAASATAYGIYQAGASDHNYFAGQVGIGAGPAATTKLYVQAMDGDSITRGIWVNFAKTLTTGQNSFTGVRSTMSYTGNQAPAPCSAFSAEYDFSPGGAQTLSALYGYTSLPTTGANATVTSLTGFYSGSDDLDGTVTNWFGFRAGTPSVSGTVSNAYGVYVEDQSASVASNSYGVYIADQDGANLNYGVYQAGTGDSNYFAGNVGINDNTPSYKLDVNGDINVQAGSVFRRAGAAGLSGTYTFGGGSAGDIATMTFSGGILTGVTTV